MSEGGGKAFLVRWLVTTLGVMAAEKLVRGIHADSFYALAGASLVLGALNAFLRPILLILSLPLLLATLGLFTLVINSGLLMLTARLVGSFRVENFTSALFGAVIISVVSLLASPFTAKGKVEVKVGRGGRSGPPKDGPPGTGSGPIIDV